MKAHLEITTAAFLPARGRARGGQNERAYTRGFGRDAWDGDVALQDRHELSFCLNDTQRRVANAKQWLRYACVGR